MGIPGKPTADLEDKAKTAYQYAKENLTIRKSAEIHLKVYKEILSQKR